MLKANENLNLSYLRKLKKDYNNLNSDQRINAKDLSESISEMEVDEVGKAHIFNLLFEQTNY
jgi:hypothetical protein